MFVNTTINCGFCHSFNNHENIHQLIELMKKNPDAKFNFELSHIGRKSEHFVFKIEDVEDEQYGYICTQFTINGCTSVSWEGNCIPWSAIYSRLYETLVTLCRDYTFDANRPVSSMIEMMSGMSIEEYCGL